MSFQFSTRTGWDLEESAFSASIRAARMSVESVDRLIDLTISNPTACGFDYDAEATLGPLLAREALVYDPDPRGIRFARRAVAAYYADHGAEVDPDALILTTSTSEAYSYLFRLLCNPGDEVLAAQPSYPLFDYLADLQDVVLRPYSLFYDFGWWIDFTELERQIGPRTRAILVVHPNNPTGHWTSVAERRRLVELCARHGLALIVDEVFLDYPLRPSEDARSFSAGEHPALTFVVSGMSKIAGLPQMKAAWLLALGPEPLLQEALRRLEVIADTFLSMNAPVQHALPAWLALRGVLQSRISSRTERNLRLVEARLPVLRTDAGWSAVLQLAASAEDLLEAARVVVHPGHFYGMREANRIVVSLLPREDEFAEGIERLRHWFERGKPS